MCIYTRDAGRYSRILNVEFKSQNCPLKNIAKDILKLVSDNGDGAFIHLLHNTNKGTLPSVFNKYSKSFSDFSESWTDNKKSIHFIVMSLNQKTLIHREIKKTDLDNLENIFFINNPKCGNIESINTNGWVQKKIA